MVIRRENLALICAVTAGNKIGSIFFHQREKSESHTLSDRQQGSLVLPLKMEGTRKTHMNKLCKKIWHYLLNRNMCITAEYLPLVLNTVSDRGKNRLFRVASSSQSFSSGFLTVGFTDHRSSCFLSITSNNSIYNLPF